MKTGLTKSDLGGDSFPKTGEKGNSDIKNMHLYPTMPDKSCIASTSAPLVSVIVPVYKVEQYLRQCLDSIVNQTYTNLEIFLVDDGSPDNCPRICDEYAARDNRIAVIHKSNGGLSEARNAALDIAKGDYIYFVDSDDFISSNAIMLLCEKALEEHADLVVAGHIAFHNILEIQELENESPFEKISFDAAMKMHVFWDPKFLQCVVAWNKLVRREIAQRYRFPKGKLCEDQYTTYKYYFDSRKTIMSDIPLYYYRQRDDSIVGKLKQTFQEELILLDYSQDKVNFLKAKGKDDLATLLAKAMVISALWFYCVTPNIQERNYLRDFLRTNTIPQNPLLNFAIHCPELFRPIITFGIHHPRVWRCLKTVSHLF